MIRALTVKPLRLRRAAAAALLVTTLGGLGGLADAALTEGAARAQGAGLDEGRTRFARGIEFYKEGNFHAALAEFRAANAAAPSYRIEYNLGQTLYQLQDYARAVRAFERYLREGGDKIEADRRKEVEGELAKLRQRVAQLTITVAATTSPIEISIDDEPRTDPQPLLVSAGRRRISVTASGYQTQTKVLDVAGSKELEVKFDLKPIGGIAPVKAAPPEATPMRPKSRTPFYIGLAATGAMAGGTAVFAILTSSKHSTFEKTLATPNASKADIDSQRSGTKTLALVADVFAGATLLAGALTVVAYVMTSGQEPERGAAPKAAKAPAREWHPLLGPGAVGVSGTF